LPGCGDSERSHGHAREASSARAPSLAARRPGAHGSPIVDAPCRTRAAEDGVGEGRAPAAAAGREDASGVGNKTSVSNDVEVQVLYWLERERPTWRVVGAGDQRSATSAR
jgi:hypothetical protein